jgi:hypothetical protein
MALLDITRRVLIGGTAAALLAASAHAHHGWDWTEEEEMFELTGTVAKVYIGEPHPTVNVEAEDGLWIVELAPRERTIAAGFTEDSAKIGDQVTAIGHRASDRSVRKMKAVSIIVNGRRYDVYPELIDS